MSTWNNLAERIVEISREWYHKRREGREVDWTQSFYPGNPEFGSLYQVLETSLITLQISTPSSISILFKETEGGSDDYRSIQLDPNNIQVLGHIMYWYDKMMMEPLTEKTKENFEKRWSYRTGYRSIENYYELYDAVGYRYVDNGDFQWKFVMRDKESTFEQLGEITFGGIRLHMPPKNIMGSFYERKMHSEEPRGKPKGDGWEKKTFDVPVSFGKYKKQVGYDRYVNRLEDIPHRVTLDIRLPERGGGIEEISIVRMEIVLKYPWTIEIILIDQGHPYDGFSQETRKFTTIYTTRYNNHNMQEKINEMWERMYQEVQKILPYVTREEFKEGLVKNIKWDRYYVDEENPTEVPTQGPLNLMNINLSDLE